MVGQVASRHPLSTRQMASIRAAMHLFVEDDLASGRPRINGATVTPASGTGCRPASSSTTGIRSATTARRATSLRGAWSRGERWAVRARPAIRRDSGVLRRRGLTRAAPPGNTGSSADERRRETCMLFLILDFLLVLLLLGTLPTWGYSSGWGYGPTGRARVALGHRPGHLLRTGLLAAEHATSAGLKP